MAFFISVILEQSFILCSSAGLNCPFKAHRPVKTSSPIEKKSVANCTEEVNNKEGVMSPILFPCEDNMDNGYTTNQ